MSENFQIAPKKNYQKKIKRLNDAISSNLDIDFPFNLDIMKIKELINKSAELIIEEKVEEGIKILKKIELFLENNIMSPILSFDKKILVIILHNIACCYQKLKIYDNCISYLESVIYHYDLSIEKRHNIKINENYLIQRIKENKEDYALLGDMILELRYSAKFHLQMYAVLNDANKHVDALKQAKLASILCEDNLVKTHYLYRQFCDKQLKNGILSANKNNINNIIYDMNNNNLNEEDNILINDKIKFNSKVINELYNIVMNFGKYNFLKSKNHSFSNKLITLKNEFYEAKNKNKKNNFNSYLNYRMSEISKYNSRNSLINKIRHIFGGAIKTDEWIQLLNIENILYLSPLNYDDLDLDSDSRFELLKDTILEKIVMLTVSYYCISKEMKYLTKDKNNKKTNGEHYLSKAMDLSTIFFPASSPIMKYFISNYYKNYGQNMEIIPEGKIMDVKVNLIRNELEQNKETLSFIKLNKINYLINKIQNNNNCLNHSNNNSVFKNINLNNILIPRLNINNSSNICINNKETKYSKNKINNNLSHRENKENKTNTINIDKLMNFTESNKKRNLNKNSNTNINQKENKNSKKKKTYKSSENSKKKTIPQKDKNYFTNKPLSSNSINMNNSNSNKTKKAMKFIRSFNNSINKNKKHSQSQSNSKNKNNNNKNEIELKKKYKNVMKINLNLNIKNNFDLLPNKNFLNFAKCQKSMKNSLLNLN